MIHLCHGFDIILQNVQWENAIDAVFENPFLKIYRCANIRNSYNVYSAVSCLMFGRVYFVLTLQNNRMYNMNVECLMRVYLPLTDLHVWAISLYFCVLCISSFRFVSFGSGLLFDFTFGKWRNSFCRMECIHLVFPFVSVYCVCGQHISVHCNYFRFQ